MSWRTDLAGWLLKDPAQFNTFVANIGGQQSAPRRGSAELIAAWRSSPWLRAVTSKIASHFAAVPWRVYRAKRIPGSKSWESPEALARSPLLSHYHRASSMTLAQCGFAERAKRIRKLHQSEGLEEIEGHPLQAMLGSGNPLLNGLVMRRLLMLYIDLKGEAFWVIERNGNGVPAELWPLPPHWVAEAPSPGKPTFTVEWFGNRRMIPQEDVIWFREPDLANPYGRGSGIGESLGDEIETDEYASKYVKTFFLNRGKPDLLVAIEGAKGDALREAKQKFEDENRGFYKAHRSFWHGGKMTVHELQTKFTDMELSDLRTWERDAFISVYGTPPEILGVLTNSNRATIKEARVIMATEVIRPRCEFVRAQLQQSLAPLVDPTAIIDYDLPDPADEERELDAMKAAPWAPTLREWRARMGLADRGDDDDVHATPYSLTFERSLSAPREEPEPAAPSVPELPPAEVEALALPARTKAVTESDIDRVVQALTPERLTRRLRPLWDGELKKWGERQMTELGLDPTGFDMLNPLVAGHLENFSSTRISGINDTTMEKVRGELTEGVRAGEGIDDLAKRIEGVMSEASSSRAEMIARTEVVRSSNFGSYASFKLSGVVSGKQWIATADDRVRESHAEADGQTVGVGESFTIGGHDTLYPGNTGVGEEDINCMLPGAVVQGAFVGGARMKFSGPVVTLETLGGRRLTVTANHKVLTSSGWIAAKKLRNGDKLLGYIGGDKTVPADHVHNRPAMVEEVFCALSSVAAPRTVRRYAEQLHGDAEYGQGEIDVVDVLGALRVHLDPELAQSPGKGALASTHAPRGSVMGDGSTLKLPHGPGLPGGGGMGGSYLSLASDVAHSGPLEQFRIGPAAKLHPILPHARTEAVPGDAGLYAQLLEGSPREIFTDEVIEIRNGNFSGHVYDLQSTSGWLIADGLVISNCRCTVSAVIGEPEEERGARVEMWKAFERERGPWEKAATAQAKKAFAEQEADVLAALREAE